MLTLDLLAPGQGLYAASKKKSKKGEEKVEVPVVSGQEAPTKVSLPASRRNVSYFSKINLEILNGVENGTPESIRQAMNFIRKSESEYQENERVLINIASAIMQYAWPSEKFPLDVPSVSENGVYLGALEFVKNGIFDSSTGNTDFLSTILPAFVALDSDVSPEILVLCEEALVKASEFNETSVLADYLRGVVDFKMRNFASAEGYFGKVYGSNPEIYENKLYFARTEYELKKYETSSGILQGILSGNPLNLEVLKLGAKVAFDMKDYEKSEEYVARVLQQVPNSLEFVLFRAKILVQKNDYIHAVSLLDMYSRQNDTNRDYLILRTKVQVDWSKNAGLASETIEKALALYPDDKDALLLAAQIASITDSPVAGKYADELVQKILETDPENRTALVYALNGLVRREEWDSAYEISRRLVAFENPESDVILRHTSICLKLGKKSEALNIASGAYNSNPQDETILQAYILAQIANGNTNQSITLINSLLDSSSSKMKSYLYYRRSFLQGTESSSLADLRSSLIANPRNSDALLRLYEIYFAKEDYKKAQYYLKQVVALNPNDSSIKKLNESLTKLLQ